MAINATAPTVTTPSIAYTPQRHSELVKEMRESLTVYDATANTGNDALDALITERNFSCARNDIRMTCSLMMGLFMAAPCRLRNVGSL